MPQFDITFYYSQIFWLVVVFSCLYLLIHKFVVPIMEKILIDRQSSIEINIANAENLATKASELNKYYVNEIEKISITAENIKKEAKTKLEQSFLSQKLQLNNQLKAQIEKNDQDIEANNKSFWLNHGDLCVNLAIFLIEKITNQQVKLELVRESYKKIK